MNFDIRYTEVARNGSLRERHIYCLPFARSHIVPIPHDLTFFALVHVYGLKVDGTLGKLRSVHRRFVDGGSVAAMTPVDFKKLPHQSRAHLRAAFGGVRFDKSVSRSRR